MCWFALSVLLLCSPSAELIKFGLFKSTNGFKVDCPGLARSCRPPLPSPLCRGDKDGSGFNSSLMHRLPILLSAHP